MPKQETAQRPTQPAANRPVHEVRFGSAKAVVWLNQTSNGPMHSVTVARVYKNGDGKWQEASSFATSDLLELAKAVNQAHSWIHTNKQ